MTDVHRWLHLLLALDEDGLDVAAFHAYGDGNLITADAGVTGGMFREKGQDAVALQNAVGNGAPPLVAELDLVLVEPDIVSALCQVGFDAADKLFVAVVAIAEEDAHFGKGLLDHELVPAVFADVDIPLLAEDDIFRRTFGAMNFSRHRLLLSDSGWFSRWRS